MFGFGNKDKKGGKPALSKKQIDADADGYEALIGVCVAEDCCKRTAYLANVKPTTTVDSNGAEVAALLLYFMEEGGAWTKATYAY